MKFLRDGIWQFAAFIVAVIALGVTVYFFILQRENKALQVQVLSNSPVASVTPGVSSDISITYKGRPANSLSLILLKVENIGNVPIRETDFSQPIRIAIAPTAEIGEVNIQETRPSNLGLQATIVKPNQVELSPVLLNAGDQAIVKLFSLNNDGTLNVDARIVGIAQISVVSALEQSTTVLTAPEFLVIVVLAGVSLNVIYYFIIGRVRKIFVKQESSENTSR